MDPHRQHKQRARGEIGCAVITVSDTRTPETDTSGLAIQELLRSAGHRVVGYQVVPDDPVRLKGLLVAALADPRMEAVITNGGTGVSPRDGTVEVVEGLLEKKLAGFGEIFRYLSYQQIGSAAIMSRAVAGIARGRVLIALPGSPGAVRLAMEKLVIPELGHMLSQARKG